VENVFKQLGATVFSEPRDPRAVAAFRHGEPLLPRLDQDEPQTRVDLHIHLGHLRIGIDVSITDNHNSDDANARRVRAGSDDGGVLAALTAKETLKVNKHAERERLRGFTFVPLVFTSSGTLGPRGMHFVKSIVDTINDSQRQYNPLGVLFSTRTQSPSTFLAPIIESLLVGNSYFRVAV